MKRHRAAPRKAQPLSLTLAVILLAGCGSGAASLATEQAGSPSTSSPASPGPATPASSTATTSSPISSPPSSPPASTAGPSSGDVTAAVRSALGLFEKVLRKPDDPAAGYLWGPATNTSGHLSGEVVARLTVLHRSGYFSDRGCAGDYFTGTQNLLDAEPTVVSAHGASDGTVTVVVRRPVTPARPDLTLVMTRRNGVWLATELATGSGPSASIFAANPRC